MIRNIYISSVNTQVPREAWDLSRTQHQMESVSGSINRRKKYCDIDSCIGVHCGPSQSHNQILRLMAVDTMAHRQYVFI